MPDIDDKIYLRNCLEKTGGKSVGRCSGRIISNSDIKCFRSIPTSSAFSINALRNCELVCNILGRRF